MKIALAYPELFRGALLNAGSDPIGDSGGGCPPMTYLPNFKVRLAWCMSRDRQTTGIFITND